jgi:hypothetical protein
MSDPSQFGIENELNSTHIFYSVKRTADDKSGRCIVEVKGKNRAPIIPCIGWYLVHNHVTYRVVDITFGYSKDMNGDDEHVMVLLEPCKEE